MATPLSAFNKYSGVLMAVMCVLLMFAFVVADPLMQYAGGGSGGSSGDNQVVATWNGGRVNERQLEQAVVHRNILSAFQQAVYEVGTRDAMEDGAQDLGLRVQPIDLPRSREQGVEQSVVRTKIFAERAREAGMVVSDDMIVDYLRALGRDRVSNDQMREILSRMNAGNGRRATISFVFDLLREAMLANNYLASHAYVFQTILPEERWEDWKKVNERVVVEAAPLPIEAFLDEAPEPTDAEVEAFFEEYRGREPTTEVLTGYGNVELPSAKPAFATPPRVKLAYLRADFAAAVEQATAEVTDEQIAQFYEDNKESFIQADRGLFGDDGLLGSSELTEDESSDTAESDTDEMDNAADEEAMEEEAAEAPAAEETTEEATEEAETPADEAAPTESNNPLRNREAVEEEEEEEEEKNASDTAEPAAEPAEEETSDADDSVYQPLEEVKDEIRRRLAIELAAKQIMDKMNRVKSTLDDDFAEFFDKQLEAEAAGGEGKAPAAPESLTNLKPLAEAEALELVEMDQASQMELRDTEVGRSRNTDSSDANALPGWYLAFRSEDVDRYQPVLTRDADGNHYLMVVTERYPAVIPKLEDVRDQVVAAWKRDKAAEIALKKAEELAKQATEKGGSLAELLADQEDAPVKADDVLETDAFSLLTIGPVAPNARQVPLRLSQPEPLVAPGPDLLQAVFELKPGAVGAELNHDHSIAYVLRIAERIGAEDELRREFLRDGDRWVGGDALNQGRAQGKILALIGNLLDESGLDWDRTPDQLQ
ncbi:periplasmic folding chaperone [Botrimarina colliarenosi]|uniref:Periplasmic folding chaperone n=1 Tax=Botrimarina colliarenosi TaxID=2528001 RepID=A0A5C6A7I0_9BACT|nr:hypothetical protein [Botrimarina colliarenosi]TWT95884.1 periplasmic folding chaperone [Botrimarina colliarenosi]